MSRARSEFAERDVDVDKVWLTAGLRMIDAAGYKLIEPAGYSTEATEDKDEND